MKPTQDSVIPENDGSDGDGAKRGEDSLDQVRKTTLMTLKYHAQ